MQPMSQAEVDARMTRLKEKYPAMFEHTELKPGEIAVSEGILENAMLSVVDYHNAGMPSARMSKTYTMGKIKVISSVRGKQEEPRLIDIEFYTIFVSQREWAQAERLRSKENKEAKRASAEV